MYRKTYALIDNDKLRENVKEITSKYNYKYYIGVVKNNAYSHGIKIVNSLIKGGVNYLAVASLDEAVNIRCENKDIPILVLEPINLEYIKDIIKNNITITVDSLDYLKDLIKMNKEKEIKVHLKIDSGMNRLGFKNKDDINTAYKLIKESNNLFLEGIFSHFARSRRGENYYNESVTRLLDTLSDINLNDIPIIHFDRSLTMVSHDKINIVNGVRLGIIMYGFSGSIKLNYNGIKGKLRKLKRNMYLKKNNINDAIYENNLSLKTAFSLYSEVISIREVSVNERVGYNASYIVKENGFIATIPIGYADGVDKSFKYIYINNKCYNIVSDSMDMIMVLVDKSVSIGDKVEIFGDNITLREASSNINTNAYHLLSKITTRVPRVHIEDNKKIEVKY